LVAAIKNNSITTVHYHQRIFIPYIYCIRLLFPSVKIVYTHWNVYNDRINYLLLADHIIAPSKAAAAELTRYHKASSSLVHHGVDPVTEPFHKNTSGLKTIGYVGRFVEWKGIFILLHAACRLFSVDTSYRFIFRGDGEELGKMRRFISDHGAEEYIALDSPETSLDTLYRGIDVIVLPSLTLEGYGMVLVEAMARQIPVIGTTVGGMTDIITNEVNGLLIPPNDVQALVDAVAALFSSPERYREISLMGFQYVQQHANISATVERYRAIYTALGA
jgi:glycosyltransferase involved in cell wall biosynthesis